VKNALVINQAHRGASMSKELKQFLRLKKVLEIVGISRSQLYLLEKCGKFPGRLSLGPRSVAWDANDVAAWQAERIAISKKRREVSK
jgi:prophage regulatory protein